MMNVSFKMMGSFVSNDELCINDDELCINNDECEGEHRGGQV